MTTTMTVRLPMLQHDRERSEVQAFERLKAELALAFAVPDSSYHHVTAADIMACNPAPLPD